LDREIVNLEDQLRLATQQRINANQMLQLGATLNPLDRFRYEKEAAEAQTKMEGLTKQLTLQRDKQAKMIRKSPMAGTVMTWDVERVLNRRPVVMGQVLMTIADKTKDWEVEVLMPEKRMSYLDYAFSQSTIAKVDGTERKYLDVDFIMLTDPSIRYNGRLYTDGVSTRSELDGEEGPVVRLRCIPDENSMRMLSRNPGARVIAKVKAGKRSAAFVWFHEVVEWVRAYLLF
jgi:hypothetical protein